MMSEKTAGVVFPRSTYPTGLLHYQKSTCQHAHAAVNWLSKSLSRPAYALMRQPDSKFQYIQQAPTDICLLVYPPHLENWRVQKIFTLAPLANPVLYPHLKICGAATAKRYYTLET